MECLGWGGYHQQMATFVLIPGAGGVAWYWHRIVPLLKDAKHQAIAVDLPGDDERAGLSAYADRVVKAIGRRKDAILVAQSLGGFTAALVCDRVPIRMLVFLNAMIPLPGETAGKWWDNTGSTAARTAAARHGGYSEKFDEATYFLHDVSRSSWKANGTSVRRRTSCSPSLVISEHGPRFRSTRSLGATIGSFP